MNRRQFLRLSGAVAGSVFTGAGLWQEALATFLGPAQGGPSPYGPLQDADENGIMLPAGFRSRLLAKANQVVEGTPYVWHRLPDGGATFPASGGWIYVSNSEFLFAGGAGALRFDHRGEIVDAYSICSGTGFNCAGGATPWRTWLSCEEHPRGIVWECDPFGVAPQVARPALGTFQHEAVAVDLDETRLYLTEDVPDGCFYRFTPEVWADLSAGLLEAAAVDALGQVTWHEVPEPNPDLDASETPTRHQVPGATPFAGGEGIVFHEGHVYFTTKGDDRVWDYHPASQTLSVLYDAALDPAEQLTGVDNITVSRYGDLIVAEDGGNMELVILTPQGVAAPLLRVTGQDTSELTGPAFDPFGRRLYFSSQRGRRLGLTYEVTGPFRSRFHC